MVEVRSAGVSEVSVSVSPVCGQGLHSSAPASCQHQYSTVQYSTASCQHQDQDIGPTSQQVPRYIYNLELSTALRKFHSAQKPKEAHTWSFSLLKSYKLTSAVIIKNL